MIGIRATHTRRMVLAFEESPGRGSLDKLQAGLVFTPLLHMTSLSNVLTVYSNAASCVVHGVATRPYKVMLITFDCFRSPPWIASRAGGLLTVLIKASCVSRSIDDRF